MAHQETKAEVQQILNKPDLSTEKKIDLLEDIRQDRRAQMRAATEGGMAADDDIGDDLKLLDEVLADLESQTTSIEDGGAATL